MRELLLINLDGLTYGIWADEVRALEDLQVIHHLPLSPACIAGMSIIHDRTAALADLSVCLGHGSMKRSGKGQILFMSDQEKVMGFVIEGELTRVFVAHDRVYPMPEYLKTPVIDACVMEETRLYPLINIAWLYTRVQTSDREPPMASLFVAPSCADDSSGTDSVRVVKIGTERFSVHVQGVAEEAETPGPLTRLKMAPQFVSGILFHQGRVLPVIDLMQRIFQRKSGPDALMFVVDIGGSRFGFLVQEDRGMISDGLSIKPLPLVAQSPWLLRAVKHDGETVPLIDLAELIAGSPDEEHATLAAHQYTPDSLFPSRFGKEDVDVMEFSLLGIRHALPKSEVEDILDFRPYRHIPNVLPIVVGVTEHKDELLPVIDLAMVFGRQSRTTPEWRMVLVQNGDFRALVITEAVINERRLALDIQRAVPIALPHLLVYGCYPEADAVHLVLNVEAMTVHFEKSMAKGLMPAFGIKETVTTVTPEGPEVSGEMAASFEETAEPDTESVLEQREEQSEPVASFAEQVMESHDAPKIDETERIQRETASITGDAEQAAAISAEEPGMMVSPEQPPEIIIDDAALSNEQCSVLQETKASEEAILIEEQKYSLEGQGPDASSEAVFVGDFEERTAERVNHTIHTTAEALIVGDGTSVEEPPIGKEPPSSHMPVEPEPSIPELLTAQETLRSVPEASPPVVADREVQKDEQAWAPSSEAPAHHIRQYETVTVEQTSGSAVPFGKANGKNWFIGAAISLVLVAILYLFGIFDKKGVLKIEHERAVETAANEKASQSLKAPPGSLVLDVPADTSASVNMYIVEEGDTLWDISKRFTGNATNYPRIAGENRIVDPDLIFPGQKVYLNKTK